MGSVKLVGMWLVKAVGIWSVKEVGKGSRYVVGKNLRVDGSSFHFSSCFDAWNEPSTIF